MNNKTLSDKVRWSEITNQHYGWPLALICLGVSLHALDSLVVATMMPAIVGEIGGDHLISWNVSLYELGSIIASAACGLVTVRYGLRIPMCLTALVFAIGCVVSAMAPEMQVVLLGRFIQGLGGGGLLAFSFVASAVLFPRRLLARVMGAVSVFWGASAFAGPLLGGVFVEFSTWRISFMAFAVAAILLSLWILARIGSSKSDTNRSALASFPVWRLVWLSTGVVAIGYGGVGISVATTPLFVVVGFLCIVQFLRLDGLKDADRMLPSKPLSLGNPVGAGLVMVLCFSSASIALSIYGALILSTLHGIPIITTGYIIATPAIGWSLASIIISGLPERYDARLIGFGMFLAIIGIAGFVYGVTYGPVWLIAGFGITEGTGFGIAWAFITRRMCKLVPRGEVERITSAIPTAQAIGYAVGASYLGIIANIAGFTQHGTSSDQSAATIIFLGCVPIALLGLAATMRFVTVDIETQQI